MAFFQKRKLFVKMNEYDPVYDDEDEDEDDEFYDDYYIDTTIYGEKPLGTLPISCIKQTL